MEAPSRADIVSWVEDFARAAGLAPGTRLGRYTLLRRFAMGGMAELYLAHQKGAAGFEKIVALKRILPHLAEDRRFTRMFLDEARLAAGLEHPNLVHVLDFGEYEGEHFLTMEYVHGRNLLHLLSEQSIPLEAGLTIVSRVARGLHDLHEQHAPDGRPLRLVHRDVSPSNVLVAYDGTVKLTDFGITKAMALTSATTTGTFKGKLGHSSPEQARGETVDRRSDVFCLGILLYEVTTGVRAFSGANEFAVLGKVARGQYEPLSAVAPDYPVALAQVVDRALAANPEGRFPSARAFANAVEDFADTAGHRLSPDSVARAMHVAFGDAPPVVASAELELATRSDMSRAAVAASLDEAEPRRSRVPPAIAVGLAGVIGAGAAWVLRPTLETAPDAGPSSASTAELDVESEARPVVSVDVEQRAELDDAHPPDPVADAPEAPSEPVTPTATAPAEAEGPSRSKSRRQRKRRRKGAGVKSKTPGLEALYPPD